MRNEKEENMKRMRKIRAMQTSNQIEKEREEARNRMKILRSRMCQEDYDYDKFVKKHRMRRHRQGLSGKEHLRGNLLAKKGHETS